MTSQPPDRDGDPTKVQFTNRLRPVIPHPESSYNKDINDGYENKFTITYKEREFLNHEKIVSFSHR
ncbi:hypothetical protein J25TS5_38010 [Paenibacillus faecis]|nr:hypothetical protein J25TS5_38010 [Paenibacillus faecis]